MAVTVIGLSTADTITGEQAIITGDMKLSAAAARVINRLCGHHVVQAAAASAAGRAP